MPKTNDDETSKQVSENKEDYSTERWDFACGKSVTSVSIFYRL